MCLVTVPDVFVASSVVFWVGGSVLFYLTWSKSMREPSVKTGRRDMNVDVGQEATMPVNELFPVVTQL